MKGWRWGLVEPLRRPDQRFHPPREVQQRPRVGQGDAVGKGHGVAFDLGFGRLQAPGLVVDLGAVEALLAAERVEAVEIGRASCRERV